MKSEEKDEANLSAQLDLNEGTRVKLLLICSSKEDE